MSRRERRRVERTEPTDDRGRVHRIADGSVPHDQAQPSDLALSHLHLGGVAGERGAPGIGFGE